MARFKSQISLPLTFIFMLLYYSRLGQNPPDKLVSKVLFQTVFRVGISQPYTWTNKTNYIIYSSCGNLSFKTVRPLLIEAIIQLIIEIFYKGRITTFTSILTNASQKIAS